MSKKCKHIWKMIVANVLGYSIYECEKCKMQADNMSELPTESITKAVKK
jgi:ribosomal protein L37AE/L43A